MAVAKVDVDFIKAASFNDALNIRTISKNNRRAGPPQKSAKLSRGNIRHTHNKARNDLSPVVYILLMEIINQ